MTEGQAKALVATLAAAFPNQKITQATLNVYAQDLVDLNFRVATEAVESVRRGAKFLPSIAEIRSTAAEVILGAPAPMTAFDQVSTKPLEERHPLAQRAKRMVGDDWDWKQAPSGVMRKAFLAAYEEVKAEATRAIVTPALAAAERRAIEAGQRALLPAESAAERALDGHAANVEPVA